MYREGFKEAYWVTRYTIGDENADESVTGLIEDKEEAVRICDRLNSRALPEHIYCVTESCRY